ncbi:hypothetical protein BHE74_00020204 [Ensete ventricosum]|nr:hypothetical protein BHE74_00020204 [Ensete ventricosum]
MGKAEVCVSLTTEEHNLDPATNQTNGRPRSTPGILPLALSAAIVSLFLHGYWTELTWDPYRVPVTSKLRLTGLSLCVTHRETRLMRNSTPALNPNYRVRSKWLSTSLAPSLGKTSPPPFSLPPFSPLGFPAALRGEVARSAFLDEIDALEEFLRDPWTVRPADEEVEETVQVWVPRVAQVAAPPSAAVDDGGGGGGGGAGDEVKRALLQRQALAASLAAEDYVRRLEAGNGSVSGPLVSLG